MREPYGWWDGERRARSIGDETPAGNGAVWVRLGHDISTCYDVSYRRYQFCEDQRRQRQRSRSRSVVAAMNSKTPWYIAYRISSTITQQRAPAHPSPPPAQTPSCPSACSSYSAHTANPPPSYPPPASHPPAVESHHSPPSSSSNSCYARARNTPATTSSRRPASRARTSRDAWRFSATRCST